MNAKFNNLFQNLLEATQKPSSEQLPYRVDSNGNVIWTREGGNLEGAPEKIGGNFSCSNNHLESLEGAPEKVGGYFDCSGNQLQSLEGAPETVGGNFYCYNNPLKSLKGIPEAENCILPVGFTEKDARKEVERRKFRKELDVETEETWGDFVDQL